jgi:hypothetical protein
MILPDTGFQAGGGAACFFLAQPSASKPDKTMKIKIEENFGLDIHPSLIGMRKEKN